MAKFIKGLTGQKFSRLTVVRRGENTGGIGQKNIMWSTTKSDEERVKGRCFKETHVWRLAVYTRDNFACQKCRHSKGRPLNAHHMNSWSDFPEDRFDVNNGITLCVDCHKEFHKKYGRGRNTIHQFIEFYKERG